jgi:hypothetical protein
MLVQYKQTQLLPSLDQQKYQGIVLWQDNWLTESYSGLDNEIIINMILPIRLVFCQSGKDITNQVRILPIMLGHRQSE